MSKTHCPNCGAELSALGRTQSFCEFCGSKFASANAGLPPKSVPPAVSGQTITPPESSPEPAGYQNTHSAPQARTQGSSGCFRLILLISGIGLLTLVVFCLSTAWIWQSARRNAIPRETKRQLEQKKGEPVETDELFAAPFVIFLEENGRLPNDDEGNELVKNHPQKKYQSFRYEQIDATNFALRNRGYDGEWGTRDDHLARKSVRRDTILSPQDLQPPAVEDLTIAKKYLTSPGKWRQDAALTWLIQAGPSDLDDQKRREIAESIIQIPDGRSRRRREKSLRYDAIKKLFPADREPFPLELAIAAEERQRYSVLLAILQSYAFRSSKTEFIQFINVDDSEIQDEVDIYLARWNLADDEDVIKICQDDLIHEDRFRLAIKRICEMDLPEERSAEIGKQVFDAIMSMNRSKRRSFGREDAERTLNKLGSVETVPEMIRWLKSDPSFDNQIAARLVELGDEATFRTLVKMMCDSGALPYRIFTALKKAGVELEPVLLAEIENAEDYHLQRFAELLAICGTDRSLTALDEIRQNSKRPETRKAAKDALIKITRSNRQPAKTDK